MRRRTLFSLLLLCLLMTAGCWDFRSLDQRAFVMMTGVDRTDEDRFRVTLQIQLAGGAARGGEQEPGRGAPAFRVITGEGRTVREAIEVARTATARDLDAAFLDTIVIGEAAAGDLSEMDWFIRYPRIPMTAFVSVARGEAEPVVRAQTPGFSRPADYTRRGFSGVWSRSATVVRMPLWVLFNRNFFTPLEDGWAPALTAHKYGLNWDGMAVFRGHALAGYLDEWDAAVFNIVKGDRMDFFVTTDVPRYPGARVTFHIVRGSTKRWVSWEAGGPVLHLQSKLAGDMQELIRLHLSDMSSQQAVNEALNRKLNDMMTGLLRRLQGLESDPLGFGEIARESNPNRPELQSAARWRTEYRRARLDVRVEVQVTASGYLR